MLTLILVPFCCNSEATVDGPLKCFNPSKNWLLGWYNDKSKEIGQGGSWAGRLVAFVDYDLADPSNNEYVVLRVNDGLFVQYNRAKDFNAGTSLHKDKIVAVAGDGELSSSSSSVLLVGLDSYENHTWRGMTIEVCSSLVSPGSSVDFAELAVYPSTSPSLCNVFSTPSPSSRTIPTTTPSPITPSMAPTNHPTLQPVADTPVATQSISSRPSMQVAQWIQVGLDVDGEAAGDGFGQSVALSSDGSILAVGASGNDGRGSFSGHVRMYRYTGGAWIQFGNDLDGLAAYDQFGWSISLSADGMVVAVGAILAHGTNGDDVGHVCVYGWNGVDWQLRGSPIEGQASHDEFGWSVAISDDGTTLAAGAWLNDRGGEDAGSVGIFTWTGLDWSPLGNNLVGSSPLDWVGYSVALSSDGSVVAYGAAQGWIAGSGYVRVCLWDGTTWIQQGNTINGTESNDWFGTSVSLSGDGMVLASGAGRGNYCTVHGYDGTDWSQIGQTIRGAYRIDELGQSVALSFDGDMLVVGGHRKNSNLLAGSGHVRVYELSSNREDQWVQVGQELVGESAGDAFGLSVSISDDGTRIAGGATGDDSSGSDAGHVRVYGLRDRDLQ